ncbi:hypothetical protein PK69_10885 [Xanthomonas phaseoli pv. phaseoli]|uniref:Transmembrane protein n=2 Tax=Xanthomonas campestris pv. phaseoli TaxID=317013 RepID=A0AB34QMX6_XANCH|nr:MULTISPECIES: hypothetical protein [Xanthomonas]ATS23682.1 hypothetical protein XppCFBP412P_21620 [Xanthomonas phaseoli pv. phaseoli]ATS26573.1 hypothetical protein XppCFBP6164P_14495 [Xanthomonas phaseoli pv. phaseoli]ATS29949.1 hypothetical protein XppCFBP6546P_09125 [Xanthomonas phaseoli pv. phaseoli]ATS34836.1 hypothetical protein XppCFBP6982P_14010 [Xanthomonas phaseoli pv. phaseoli]AZU11637.1 hypothetical protein AC609_02585 [Xanthomonas phaseoli pv. phaseoli]
MFMVEPAGRKSDPQWQRSPPSAAPADAPWPAHSPVDPAVRRFRGAARYAIWRRGAAWTAVADGPHWSAALAPRVWALRQRHWPLLAVSAPMPVGAGAVALAGVQAWSPVAWTALLAAEVLLRVWVARQAGPWRTAALHRNGWQPVTRLRAISVADAVTTAQIRAGRPQR